MFFGFFFPQHFLRKGGEKKKKPKQQYFWSSLALYSLRKLFPTYTPSTIYISLANTRPPSGISPRGVCIPREPSPPWMLGNAPGGLTRMSVTSQCLQKRCLGLALLGESGSTITRTYFLFCKRVEGDAVRWQQNASKSLFFHFFPAGALWLYHPRGE